MVKAEIINRILVKLSKIKVIQIKITNSLQLPTVIVAKEIIKKKDTKDKERRRRSQDNPMKDMKLKSRIFFSF